MAVLFALAWVGCGEDPPAYPRDHLLRLGHIQVKGTHNSYHVAPPVKFPEWGYTHVPLDLQLYGQGVRQLELDINWDISAQAYRVYHMAIMDPFSTCDLLQDCLEIIKSWSDRNRQHLPLVVLIQPKDSSPPHPGIGPFDLVEKEVLAVLARDRLITPDEVLGAHGSLAEALSREGWPTLGRVRGRILLVLLADGDSRSSYTHGDKDLKGRLMFIAGEAGKPYAAVLNIDNPLTGEQSIRQAVLAGTLVRTRADTPGREALAGDTSRLQAALRSGAHLISTDYPARVSGINYVVQIPGGTLARCNPLTAPADCSPRDLEDAP